MILLKILFFCQNLEFNNILRQNNISINDMTIDIYRKSILGLYIEQKLA